MEVLINVADGPLPTSYKDGDIVQAFTLKQTMPAHPRQRRAPPNSVQHGTCFKSSADMFVHMHAMICIISALSVIAGACAEQARTCYLGLACCQRQEHIFFSTLHQLALFGARPGRAVQ